MSRTRSSLQASDSAALARTLGYAVAAIILLLDQLIKYAMINWLNLAQEGEMYIAPIFSFTWTENRGVSMGFFTADTDAMRWALVAMTGAISAFVALWIWRERARPDAFGLGLILGGAIGNIIDRVRFGYVVDYADFHIGNWRPFLVFNLADAAITIGVLILLARALLLREKAAPKESH